MKDCGEYYKEDADRLNSLSELYQMLIEWKTN